MQAHVDVSGKKISGTSEPQDVLLPNLSEVLQPLNELLRKDNVFIWEGTTEFLFTKVKKILTQAASTQPCNDPKKKDDCLQQMQVSGAVWCRNKKMEMSKQ
jgi:hypothetical protein